MLADAGYVVVAINHPGDNALSRNRVENISITFDRPAQIKRLIDFMLSVWPNASKIDHERIGFFGHSRDGYTGLALAGGNPNFRRAAARCADGSSPGSPCELLQNQVTIPEQAAIHDARIKVVVIADPGFTFLFGEEELKAVTVPVQLWSSGSGGAARINRWLPSKPDYHTVANAGHWSFLAPCSSEQTKAASQICVDALGFDRVAFHRKFNADILEFFRTHLVGTDSPQK